MGSMAIDHIFLSPHLDDAVLSCGGAMRALVTQGEGVLGLNIFAGIPDYRRLSTFAAEQHHHWGDPADPVAARRTEDEAALQLIGAEVQYWDFFFPKDLPNRKKKQQLPRPQKKNLIL